LSANPAKTVRWQKAAAVLSVAALSIILSAPALAKPADELKEIETALDTQKEKEDELKQREQSASQDLQKLQQQLISATNALQEKQNTAEELSDKLQSLAAESKSKSASLDSSRENLSTLLSALLQLSRDPPEVMLLQKDMSSDQIRRGILLRSMLPRVQAATTSIAEDLSELEKLHEAIGEQQRLVTAAEKNLLWQKDNLDKLVKIRQGLLQKTASQRAAIAKQLENLTAEAQDLRQLMQKVGQASAMPKEKDLKAKPLTLKQGLRLPVSGKTIKTFGTKDSYGVLSQGITISAPLGSPVVAPSSGKVVFAGPFKGYGQIVILAHKGGYHSFLAGFGRIDAETGQDVAAGEPMGVMPEKSGAAPSSRPELYFEWRKNGDPVDPAG